MYGVRCSLAWTFLVLALAGCGGGDASSSSGTTASGGPSFLQQVDAALNEPNPVRRARQLTLIGDRQRQALDQTGADTTLSLARKACHEIPDPADRGTGFAFLAMAYARSGNLSATRRAATDARTAAELVTDPDAKINVLAKAAAALGTAKDAGGAVALLESAEQLVPSITAADDDDADLALKRRSAALNSIAAGYQAADRKEETQRVIGASLALTDQISKPRGKADAVAAVALALAKMKSDTAAATFDRAVETARHIPEDISRAHALVDIAIKLKEAGMSAKSSPLIQEAEQAAEKVTDPGLKSEVMEKIYAARR
jgi:hypothetical protein